MPTFDFQCQQCDHVFEFNRPFGSSEIPQCTECDGETEKLIAPPAIHFKGQGFYKTDSDKKESKDAKNLEGSKDVKDVKEPKKEVSKTDKKADSPKKSKE